MMEGEAAKALTNQRVMNERKGGKNGVKEGGFLCGNWINNLK